MGSYQDASIYELSSDYTTDNGLPIVSFRCSPHLYDPNILDDVFISKLVIDTETGVGDGSYEYVNDPNVYYADGTYFADGTCTAGALVSTDTVGGNPMATLAWSNDGGHTWSSEYPASLGKMGEYKRQLLWRKLGNSKNRVFRVTMSAPVKKIIIGAYAEASA